MNDLPTRRAFARAGAAALDRHIDRALDELATERAAQHALAKAIGDKDRALEGTINREQLLAKANEAPAGFGVRDASGWHVVLHVNTKSVTVPGPWGGTRTIRIDRLRQVRP